MKKLIYKATAVFSALVMQCAFLTFVAAAAAKTVPEEALARVVTAQKLNDYYLDDYAVLANGKKIARPNAIAEAGGGSSHLPCPDSAFPAAYDLRSRGEITEAKNQANCGNCWAFGAVGSIESAMIKSGAASAASADYSEAHLTWFTLRSLVNNSADPTSGDGVSVLSPYDYGGNWSKATATIARGVGLELEANKPFYLESNKRGLMSDYPESDRYVSYAAITDAGVLKSKDEIKNALMNTGAVMVSVFYDGNSLSNSNAYYQSAVSNATNHVVLIAGWDDGYAASNFSAADRPSSGGAWLCRNSFGAGYGDNGYFWVSYEEPSLSRAVSFKAAQTEEGENIYQYDGYGWHSYPYSLTGGGVKTGKIANVFTAESSENINSVAFYTDNPQDAVTYEVKVYTGVGSQPDSGALAAQSTATGVISNCGYHRVSLAKPVCVAAGERFSVVVTLSIPSASPNEVCLAFEGSSNTGNTNPDNDEYYSSLPGCSYYQFTRTDWTDANTAGFNNTCVKAFATPSVGLEVRSYPERMQYYVGESLSTAGMVLMAHNADGSVTQVTDFTVSPTVFTAAANSQSVTLGCLIGGERYTATIAVKVSQPFISLESSSITVLQGSTKFVRVSAEPAGGELRFSAGSSACFSYSPANGGVNITGGSLGAGELSIELEYHGRVIKAAALSVNVTNAIAVSSVSISSPSLVLKYGSAHTLEARVSPDDASNKNVTWESSNPSVATVSETGVVTAKDEGSAVITATSEDGGHTATCNVVVTMTFWQRLIRWIISLFGITNTIIAIMK